MVLYLVTDMAVTKLIRGRYVQQTIYLTTEVQGALWQYAAKEMKCKASAAGDIIEGVLKEKGYLKGGKNEVSTIQ